MDRMQYPSCVISYSSWNLEIAKRINAYLRAQGVVCFFDRDDLKTGERYRDRIDRAIRDYDKLLVVLTEHSIASEWVEAEVEAALDRERKDGRSVLLPVNLDNAVLDTEVAWASFIRRTRHICDFTGWKDPDSFDANLKRLLIDLTPEPPAAANCISHLSLARRYSRNGHRRQRRTRRARPLPHNQPTTQLLLPLTPKVDSPDSTRRSNDARARRGFKVTASAAKLRPVHVSENICFTQLLLPFVGRSN
jgi:hypothetical protein